MRKPSLPLAALSVLTILTAGLAHSKVADAAPNHRAQPQRSATQRSPARPGRTAARRPPTRRADPAPVADDPGLTRELILATSASESIGRAAQGRLKNGVPVAEHEALKVLNGSRETHFGTAELVALVEHASAEVANAFPQSKLYVGDLSRPGGGHLSSHRSHRSGRDVDLGFYFTDEHGVQVESRHFVRFDRQGVGVTGWSHQEVHFDARRNWALLASMMRFEGARLQYVFVSPALQAMLLEEARRVGEPEEFIQEAERLMSHFAGGHDNHFHVRIHCPPSDEQCLNDEPRRRRRSSARRPPQRGHARH